MKQRLLWLTTVLFAATIMLAPTGAAAHVKWFLDPTDSARMQVDWSLVFSLRTGIMLAAVAGALAMLYLLQRFVGDADWPELPLFREMAPGAPTLLAIQAAITLVYAAAKPAIFVPTSPLSLSAFGLAVAAVELLIAFSFITGIADWVGAIALILLWPVSLFLGHYSDTFDMLFFVGIGIAILIIGRRAPDVARARPWFRSQTKAWPARAVAALRIFTGLAVLAPALSEKIWNPRLGAAFLAKYPHFNFMQSVFGLSWFSNDLFVFAAGVAEATIGVALMSGLLTRVVVLGMWMPFNIGIPFLPPDELIGHLPIFGIMYVLLVYSSRIAPGESPAQVASPGKPSERSVRPGAPAWAASDKQR